MHSVVTILLSSGRFIMWLFCLPLYWLLNATDYCVQGLFRHIPQGLFGKLIPQQQSTIQIKAHASKDSHASGPKLQVIAEQASKKPPVVDYYEGVRPATSNQKKNRKAAIPNKLDQGVPIQQHTKQKDIDKAAGKGQQGAVMTLRLISYTGYRWFVSWLTLSQPSIRMNRRIPVLGKQPFMRKPLAVLDTPEASARVDKMVDEPSVATSQSAPVQQKPAVAGAVFLTSQWLERAVQVYAQHAPVEAGRQVSHNWQLTTEGVGWYRWADGQEWQKEYCVEVYLKKILQYATISKICVDKAALLASFVTRQWGEASADTRWILSEKDKYFHGAVVGVGRAYTYTQLTEGYQQHVPAEKVATLEDFNQFRQHKALTNSAHSASEVLYEALRLLGQTQKGSMAICSEPRLEKGCLLEVGNSPGLVDAKKLRKVKAVPSFIQQDVGGRGPMLSRTVKGWWAGNLTCNQVEMEQFDGRGEEEHLLVPENGRQGNNHVRSVFLKLISLDDIQTAATKMQKALRKGLTRKRQPSYQHLPHTQERDYSDWFDPLAESGRKAKIKKCQEKAKISSPQFSTRNNKQDGRGGGKENIQPLPQAQLHRSGENDPFVTPVKLRTYLERLGQGDWTPINKLTEYSDLLSSTQRKQQDGSPEGEILLEAEKRLEEAVDLLASLEHSPDQDVQAVIEKITMGQEDILERMERVRHANRSNGTAFFPTEKGGAPSDKRSLNAKQPSSEKNTTYPVESMHTREEGRKLADNGYKNIKGSGSLRSVSGEQGLFTDSPQIRPQTRRPQAGQSKWKGIYGAVNKRQAKKSARSEGRGVGKNSVSAWRIGRAYSESLQDRRVSPDSTDVRSLSLTAPRFKPTTP